MNKLFSKLWKSRGLSLLLALAMVLTMLPTNSLLAGATGNGSDPNSGIATVSDNGTVSDNESGDLVTVPVTLGIESGGFVEESATRISAAASGAKLRGYIDFPDDFRIEEGKVLTINYVTDITSFAAEFTYGNGGNPTVFTKTFTSSSNALVLDDAQAIAYFEGSATNDAVTRARLKADAAAGTYFEITSVTYGAPAGAGEGEPEAPTAPSWTGFGGPTVTLNEATSAAEGYTWVKNEDGSIDVTYNPGTWGTLVFDVAEFDASVYSQVKIDITPSWSGMNLGMLDAEGTYYLNHWGPNIVAEETRHTITVNLTATTAGFVFYCDPSVGATLPEGPQTMTIHSIKVVDPTLPDAEFVDAVLSVESGAFTMTSADTMSAPEGGKLRSRITFPMDFRVEEGKVLTFYYDTNIDGLDVDPTWDWTDSSVANSTFKVDEKSAAYVMEGAWLDYFNNNTTGTNPTVRLKLDSTPAGSYFTLKYVTYGDMAGVQYDPAQVPKGLVVTYYEGIYSRGVAWNTNDTVTDNALYVVKATDGVTAENVKFDGVEGIQATYKATVDSAGDTWHTFKAHIEGLEPGATYYYRAGHEETGWSKVGSFTVEKAAAEIDSIAFINVTDSQEESEAAFGKWARVLKDAYTRMPDADFVAHTGDFVNRSESKGIHMEEWIYCFDQPMAQIMNGVMVPSAGNHCSYDYAFSDRFDINWADYRPQDTEDIKYGGSYVITYGEPENGMVLIALNNTQEAWDYDSRFKVYQLPWMIEQLEKYNDYKWKVVQFHEGIMTAGNHWDDGEVKTMRKEFPPIFAKYKVDLVLQGHDHVYTRTRSYYYGENVFEAEEGTYFDGVTPVWAATKVETRVVNGEERTVYIEPQGTHYVTINAVGSKNYPEETDIDPVIYEGDNYVTPKEGDGSTTGSICQPGTAMYGLVRIEGDLLVYDSYTYSHDTRESTLFDSFAVDKTSISGYDPSNPHEGKQEVQLYGINVESKEYDGRPAVLDIAGYNCSEPSLLDYTALKYTITGVMANGKAYNSKEKYSGIKYCKMPVKSGTYQLTISVPQDNRYFWGEKVINFEITGDDGTIVEIPEGELTEQTFVADEEHVKVTGRTAYVDDKRWLTFSAGEVEFEFYGTAASIEVVGDSSSEDASASSRQTHLGIELDGERVIDTMITKKNNTYTVLADKGQKPAWHTVTITKLSELNQSTCAITAINTTSVGEIRPTKDKELNIEFIGDSITCGYGVLGNSGDDPFLTRTEDVTLTYAGVCADILEADFSCVSNSGYGIVSGSCDGENQNLTDLIPPIYNKVAANAKQYESDDESTNVYNRTREFDACVINLGTNDSTWTHVGPWDARQPVEERVNDFINLYVDFLGEVRSKNPNAKIVCAYGLMEDALWDAIQEAVETYKAESGDTDVYSLKLPVTVGYGSGYHPDQAGQQTAGQRLASFLKSVL